MGQELVEGLRGLLIKNGIGNGNGMIRDVRRYPRIGFHLPVEIPGHLGLHMVRDFSLGGLFVETGEVRDGHKIIKY